MQAKNTSTIHIIPTLEKKTATLDLLVKILVFWRRYIQTPPSTLPNPSLLPRLGLILWAHNSAAIFKIRKKSAKKNILKITFNPKNSLNKDEYSFKSNEFFFFFQLLLNSAFEVITQI